MGDAKVTVCEPGFDKAVPAAYLSLLFIQLNVTADFGASRAFADVQPCSIYRETVKYKRLFNSAS